MSRIRKSLNGSLNCNDVFAQAETALRRRRVEEALNLYRIAEAEGFDADACCGARWVCHMLLGDFASAWRESDDIDARSRPDSNRFWDGKSLRGKHVIVRCLHGLGDTIQYIRYVPQLRRQVATLTIETQPALKLLIQESGLLERVITWGEPEPYWDRQIEVIELPRIFDSAIDTIPQNVPYLKTVPRGGLQPNSGKLRVGLVWASSRYNPARCIPLTDLSPLFEVTGLDFYSFQAGDNRDELEGTDFPIQDAFDRSGCIQAAANGLAGMDLVITVDTMMAHLAGALGMPVWMLLPFQADWRWMLSRSDSPWYPTMRLFRQHKEGDWSGPVREVQAALQSLISNRQRSISGAGSEASTAGAA